MATKPPAKAAPKSTGKAAAKPAPKTPAKKAPAKPAVKKPEVKKLVVASGPKDVDPSTPLPWVEDNDPEVIAEREAGLAQSQAELDDLASMMAEARAAITPQDTARPEPAPSAERYRDAVNVERRLAVDGPGTLSMDSLRSKWAKPAPKQRSSGIARLLNLR